MGHRLQAVGEVFGAAFGLGLTSFGGPVAHLAYFRKDYVERRKWLSEDEFSELIVLSQALPGPSSSQLGMAIGHLRAGPIGALAAWLGFTLPSAALMVAFALVWQAWSLGALAGFSHGLSLVAVAVIAQAVGQLYLSQCRGRAGVLAWGAFAALLVVVSPLTLPAVLVVSAVAGAGGLASSAPERSFLRARFGPRWGWTALALFVVLVIVLPWLRQQWAFEPLAWADAYFRTGSLVLGGGHVVLPWLQREVVDAGWVSAPAFWAGYGAAQALPGPLFSVAAFLGMVGGGWWGALVAVVAIFLPGFLLIEGCLPLWARFRESKRWRGALAGASAAVVGLLASTLAGSLSTVLVRPADVAVAVGLFLLLQAARWPAWAVALTGALVGPLVLLLP